MKKKITYLKIIIPTFGAPYVNIHRNDKVTTLGHRMTKRRMCRIAALAEKVLDNVEMLAFPVGEIGAGHITLEWLNKDWLAEADERDRAEEINFAGYGQ